jgi:hypothetical protein
MSFAEDEAIPLTPPRSRRIEPQNPAIEDCDDVRHRQDGANVRTTAPARHAQCVNPDATRKVGSDWCDLLGGELRAFFLLRCHAE